MEHKKEYFKVNENFYFPNEIVACLEDSSGYFNNGQFLQNLALENRKDTAEKLMYNSHFCYANTEIGSLKEIESSI